MRIQAEGESALGPPLPIGIPNGRSGGKVLLVSVNDPTSRGLGVDSDESFFRYEYEVASSGRELREVGFSNVIGLVDHDRMMAFFGPPNRVIVDVKFSGAVGILQSAHWVAQGECLSQAEIRNT